MFGLKRRRRLPAATDADFDTWLAQDLTDAPPEQREGVTFVTRGEALAIATKGKRPSVPKLWTPEGKRPRDIDKIIRRGERDIPEADLISRIMVERDWPPHQRHNASAQVTIWRCEGWLTFYAGKYSRPKDDPKARKVEKPKPEGTKFTPFDRDVAKTVRDEDGFEYQAVKHVRGKPMDWPPKPEAEHGAIPEGCTHMLVNPTPHRLGVPQLGFVQIDAKGELPLRPEQVALFDGNAIFQVRELTPA